jgi:hypothetical protein
MKGMLALGLLFAAAAGQLRAEGSGTRLTPDNLDKQPVRFIIQALEKGDETEVTLIVVDRDRRRVPVVVPWLIVSQGRAALVRCQLGTEKPASYDFGTLAYFSVATRLLDGARVTVNHVVPGATSEAGHYWFYLRDFVAKKAADPTKPKPDEKGDAGKKELDALLAFLKGKGVELRPVEKSGGYIQRRFTVGPDHEKKLVVGLNYLPPLTREQARRQYDNYSLPHELYRNWALFAVGGPGGNASPEYKAIWTKVLIALKDYPGPAAPEKPVPPKEK